MTEKMQQFFAAVRKIESTTNRLIVERDPAYAHHPEPVSFTDPITGETGKRCEAIYVCSVDNLDRNTTAGSVCIVTLRHGATLITQQTHRLATAAEVAKEKQAQADRRAYYDAEDARLNSQRRTFHVELPAEKAAK